MVATRLAKDTSAFLGEAVVMRFILRDAPPRAVWALEQAGVHPLLARLYAARGVSDPGELDVSLAQLLPPDGMKGMAQAAPLLADAITAKKRICIVADYDCAGGGTIAVVVGHDADAMVPPPAQWACAGWRCWAHRMWIFWYPTAWSMATASRPLFLNACMPWARNCW